MKRYIKTFLAILLVSGSLSSCATVLGGPISHCQKTKPTPGKRTRAIRHMALAADILIFFPFAILDFATGAIYVPCK